MPLVKALKIFLNSLSKQRGGPYEFTVVCKDGSRKIVEVSGQIIPFWTKRVLLCVAIETIDRRPVFLTNDILAEKEPAIICSRCHKIRDEKQIWRFLEWYHLHTFSRFSRTVFAHLAQILSIRPMNHKEIPDHRGAIF